MRKLAANGPSLVPERLFAGLAGSRAIVLAVSGGPDSTALMVLAARWAARPPTLVVTVDHGLRPESAAETALVAENAAKLGLPCRIMRAPEPRGAGNLQDWARRARYGALLQAAGESGADAIALAHHLEDQAETFLLRLARGSGVYGLAAMALQTELEGVRIVRPLLQVFRAELARVVAESGLLTVLDPSNSNPRFDRVRMREIAPVLHANGLSATRLAETAGRLGRAARALDHYARALLRGDFRVDAAGAVSGPAAPLAAAPEEVGLRALALLLASVGGAEYGPRLDRLEALWHAIVGASPDAQWKRTLHGVVIRLVAGRITAHREWGRQGPAAVHASAGSTLSWDRRFRVQVPDLPGELRLAALGESGRTFGRRRQSAVWSDAAKSMPALYDADGILAVPDGIALEEDSPPLRVFRAECLVGSRLGLSRADAPELTMNGGKGC